MSYHFNFRDGMRVRSVALFLGLLILGCAVFSGCVASNPRGGIGVIRNIEYARVGDNSLLLDIYTPVPVTNRLPVIIYIHGGSWNSGSKDPCPIGFMASRNIAIVSINYRLSQKASFPAQLYDCKGAVRWLRANAEKYSLDPDHIGVGAVSAGGHLGLLLATTAGHPELEGDVGGNLNYSSRIQCVCALYSPTDLNRLVSNPKSRANPNGDVAKLIGGAVANHVDKALYASPLSYVSKGCAPVYLLHGAEDTLVPPEQSRVFYEALEKAGVPAHLNIYPHKGHGFVAPADAAREIFAFFDQYLRNTTVENHPATAGISTVSHPTAQN